ncbi:hypothetical protein QBC46DRAFT_389567 [Diplogelasinospora grovesii]|uniref:Uncharacterized protein n=1 Tax=Diplogelasinospora grovesii TaxID=303347 RepID=A0AAN6N477_9PEZI|nr:hypothetical protein QBC46DRAFT_389567 [Diplogelasinospora grovesii]
MPRLPPAEKLSLALRKNVRDEWDNKKADCETQLSDILGETWTIDINPNAIWPYHNDGYAKESLGACIRAYVEGAIYQIKYLVGKYGDELKAEINAICSAHVLALDMDDSEPKKFSYCGCDVSDGKLRMLFRQDCLGTNIDYACQEGQLFPALNAAPAGDRPLSFTARVGIRDEYDSKAEACRKELAEMVGKPDFKLNPNFADTFAKLEAASKVKGNDLRDDWQKNLGGFTLKYFEGAVYQMKYLKVGEDDMIQEGFNEAVEKGEMAFRIVDNLKYDSYCECDIEDGVMYLQCTADKWGTNIDYAAQKLMDRL